MNQFLVFLSLLVSVVAFANNSPDLTQLETVTKTLLIKKGLPVDVYCPQRTDREDLCLMTQQRAIEYCEHIGQKLPSALDFAQMNAQIGAVISDESCGEPTAHCQKITPQGEAHFFYDTIVVSRHLLMPDTIKNYWYHTSSLLEGNPSVNYQFGSANGYLGYSDRFNAGNVACIPF